MLETFMLQEHEHVQGGKPVEDLKRWFGPLDEYLGLKEQPVGPGPAETSLLLEMGKLAAEAAPQRLFALLTAFAVGRALGRAERDDPGVDAVGFLRTALGHIRAVASAATPPAPQGSGDMKTGDGPGQ